MEQHFWYSFVFFPRVRASNGFGRGACLSVPPILKPCSLKACLGPLENIHVFVLDVQASLRGQQVWNLTTIQFSKDNGAGRFTGRHARTHTHTHAADP